MSSRPVAERDPRFPQRMPGARRIKPRESDDSLLVGWQEISRYARRSVRQLQKYARADGFPVVKFGWYITTSRSLIDTWLLTKRHLALKNSGGAQRGGPPQILRRMTRRPVVPLHPRTPV